VSDSPPTLLQRTPESYGPSYQATLFDQYRGFVASADAVSARRAAANQYYLGVNSALVSLAGFSATLVDRRAWTVLTAAAGALACVAWALTISAHARLNAAKFRVIHEFERQLPAAPYSAEWHEASREGGAGYRPVSRIERAVPVLFFVLYVALAALVFARAGAQP
jgi:hypothetical protein